MRTYKTEGIILRRINFGEADRLITIFSKHYGKQKVLGKGVRKIKSRRAPHLELFNQSVIFLHRGKNFDIITEAQTVNSFSDLRDDLSKIQAAYRICELVNELCPEHQENRPVYEFMLQTLTGISLNSNDLNQWINSFSLNLLWNLGFLPNGKNLSFPQIDPFIENIIEKKLKTVMVDV